MSVIRKPKRFARYSNSRRIEITTFALHNEHQRQNRRTHHRILREMPIDLRLDLGENVAAQPISTGCDSG